MVRLLLLGFFAAVIVFTVILWIGGEALDYYFIGSDLIYKSEGKYIDDLSNYVKKKSIPATDTDSLSVWSRKKGVTRLMVSRKRVLLYDSAYPDTVIFGEAETVALHRFWPYFYTVPFADGDADVYIDADYRARYRLLLYVLDAIISMSVWLLLFVLGIRKEVKYIQQLSRCVAKIELGTLDSGIPVRGRDELAALAGGLNQMRLALIEKERNEKQMKAAQDELVLGMAHDLRTPLTGLMSFLEIAKMQPSHDDCVNYIEKAYAKSTQIRDLSNRLFEFFLIDTQQSLRLEEPADAEYALGEYLSEFCGRLEADGYPVSIEQLCWEPARIQICTDYMGRIIDNLSSNIKRYADRTAPVELSAAYHPSCIDITIRNKPAQPNQYVHGTGIGVKNIRSMMGQMKGLCSVNITPEHYSITLSFPVCK